jgi:hypothetical protein
MSQIPSVRSVREGLLEQARQSPADDVALATVRQDLEACARVVRRAIERAQDFASRGLLCEACSIIEDFPDLVRQAEALRTLPEDARATGGVVHDQVVALVDRGILPSKTEVEALMAIVMRAEAQRPLVDALRMSVLRGEPLGIRLRILKRIRAADQRNRMWLDQIDSLETAWLRQFAALRTEPNASYESLEEAVEALGSHDWVASVPRGLQEALLARLTPMRGQRAGQRYEALACQIHDAAARMDRDEIIRLEAAWALVNAETGRLPTQEIATAVAPAFAWLTSLEREANEQRSFDAEVERLEHLLNDARPAPDVERQMALLRDFGREAPAGLLDRAAAFIEIERSRQHRRHRLYLVSALAAALVLAITGGLVVRAAAEARERDRELLAFNAAIETGDLDTVRVLSEAVLARGDRVDAALAAAVERGATLLQARALREEEVRREIVSLEAELARAPARPRLVAMRSALTALRPESADADRLAVERLDTACMQRIEQLDATADRESRAAVATADDSLARWKLPETWPSVLQVDAGEWSRYIASLDEAASTLARARERAVDHQASISRIDLKREIIDSRRSEAQARSDALAAALRDLDPVRLCAPATLEADFAGRLSDVIQRHGAVLARQDRLGAFEAAAASAPIWSSTQAWRDDFRPRIVALLGQGLDGLPSDDERPRALELIDGFLAAHPITPLRRHLLDLAARFDPARQASRWSSELVVQSLANSQLENIEEVPLQGNRRLYVRAGQDPDPRTRAIEDMGELSTPVEKLSMILSVKREDLAGPPAMNDISAAWMKAIERIGSGRTSDAQAELLALVQAIASSPSDPLLVVRALRDATALLEQSGHMPPSASMPLSEWRDLLQGTAGTALGADWIRAGYEPEANHRMARRDATAALRRFPDLGAMLAAARAEQAKLAAVLQPLVPAGVLTPADASGVRVIHGRRLSGDFVAARRFGSEWEFVDLTAKDGVVEQPEGLPKGPILIFRRLNP